MTRYTIGLNIGIAPPELMQGLADVTITVDGKKVIQPAGTLLIEACKNIGIEIPSFCYYPDLSLQGACRMCLVEIVKMSRPISMAVIQATKNLFLRQQDAAAKSPPQVASHKAREPSRGSRSGTSFG